MQLEVLVPRQWSHRSKEFLKAWYTRIGYRSGVDRAVRGELSRARPAPRDTLRLRHPSQELADLAGP
jgi:hypothetical protein